MSRYSKQRIFLGTEADALLRHLVLFFRDQDLSEEQQLPFPTAFGPPVSASVAQLKRFFNIYTVKTAADSLVLLELKNPVVAAFSALKYLKTSTLTGSRSRRAESRSSWMICWK